MDSPTARWIIEANWAKSVCVAAWASSTHDHQHMSVQSEVTRALASPADFVDVKPDDPDARIKNDADGGVPSAGGRPISG